MEYMSIQVNKFTSQEAQLVDLYLLASNRFRGQPPSEDIDESCSSRSPAKLPRGMCRQGLDSQNGRLGKVK